MTDPDVMQLRPYWMYDAVNDSHTRPSHLCDGREGIPGRQPYMGHMVSSKRLPLPLHVRTLKASGGAAGLEG